MNTLPMKRTMWMCILAACALVAGCAHGSKARSSRGSIDPPAGIEERIEKVLTQAEADMAAGQPFEALDKVEGMDRDWPFLGRLRNIESAANRELDRREQVRDLVGEARLRLDEKQYDEAVRCADGALALEPDHPEATRTKEIAARVKADLENVNAKASPEQPAKPAPTTNAAVKPDKKKQPPVYRCRVLLKGITADEAAALKQALTETPEIVRVSEFNADPGWFGLEVSGRLTADQLARALEAQPRPRLEIIRADAANGLIWAKGAQGVYGPK